jgi:methionine-S-sulfoxide reductase
METGEKTEKALLAGGCFWCLEALFKRVPGVLSVTSGYCGGAAPHPTYEEVCEGTTGHAETVEVVFDLAVISYREILDFFWKFHDPTTLNRQRADIGEQYRSVIFIWMRTSANLPNCPKVPRRQHSTAPLSLRSSRQGISGLPKHGTRSTMSAIPMPHTAVLSLLQSWQNCASCLHALFSVERLAQLRRTTRHRPRRQRQYHNHEHIRQHDRKFIGKANSKHLDRELERLSDAEKKTPA